MARRSRLIGKKSKSSVPVGEKEGLSRERDKEKGNHIIKKSIDHTAEKPEGKK